MTLAGHTLLSYVHHIQDLMLPAQQHLNFVENRCPSGCWIDKEVLAISLLQTFPSGYDLVIYLGSYPPPIKFPVRILRARFQGVKLILI
jgi:hypothetical protein